jgi:protein archease
MNSEDPDVSFLDHTADLGIKVRAGDLRQLFQKSAMAMMRIMVGTGFHEVPNTRRATVRGRDLADLMVRWLGELLYLFQGEKEMVVATRIHAISNSRLEATLSTVPFDPVLHEIICEIKAVTYHQIDVSQRNEQWEAVVIFDL